MQPEQLRAARGVLNWSLDRLADASGVHRNTLSNFETRKYAGDPEKLAAVRRTLERAGVIFIDENGQSAGARMRRFQIGDLVRFRPETRVRLSFDVAADESGTVVGVEAHPPRTGPTYRMDVQFERVKVSGTFRYEYELVQAAEAADAPIEDVPEPARPPSPSALVEGFIVLCERARNDFDLHYSLFEQNDPRVWALLESIAPLTFGDLRRISAENLVLQFAKITDKASSGKSDNLTSNFILEKLSWPDAIRKRLRAANDRLMEFRRYIDTARGKRVAHHDVDAQVLSLENLGHFPEGADFQFFQDLQTFVDIAYGHLNSGHCRPIAVAMSTDTHKLVRALEESVVFDQCRRCTEAQRAVAVLDYEQGSSHR